MCLSSEDYTLKNTRKSKLQNQLFCIIWALVVVYFVVQPIFHNAALTKVVWIPGAMLLFAINCSLLIQNMILKKDEFIVLGILCGILLVGIGYYGIYASVDKMIAVFLFVNMLLLIVNSNKFTLFKGTIEWIYWCNVILAGIFVFYSQTTIANKVMAGGGVRYTKFFVFNLDNSNIAGLYLYYIFCILLIGFASHKHKTLQTVLIAAVLWMMWMTGTRTCMLAAIAVALMMFVLRKKIPTIVVWAVSLFPMIFIYLYLWLYNSGFENIEIAGKTLFSGRQETFMIYLNKIQGLPQILFGNLGACTFANAHNAPLSFFCSVGIVGLFCIYYFFIKRTLHMNKMDSRSSSVMVACILGIFIQTSGEAGALLGGFPGAPFLCTMFLLGSDEYGDSVKRKKRS